MSLFSLFGPPNVEKLKATQNVKGLIRILKKKDNPLLRSAAISALGDIGDLEASKALITDLIENRPQMPEEEYVAIVKIIARLGMEGISALVDTKNSPFRKGLEEAFTRTGATSAKVLAELVQAIIADQKKKMGHSYVALQFIVDCLAQIDNDEAFGASILFRREVIDFSVNKEALNNKKIPTESVPRLLTDLKSQNWSVSLDAATLLLQNRRILQGFELDDEQQTVLAIVGNDRDTLQKLGSSAVDTFGIVPINMIFERWDGLFSEVVREHGNANTVEVLFNCLDTWCFPRGADSAKKIQTWRRMLSTLFQIFRQYFDSVSFEAIRKIAQWQDEYEFKYTIQKAYEDTDDPWVTKYYPLEQIESIDCRQIKQFAIENLSRRQADHSQ